MQDELAQAVKAKNGIPLLITEHDAIVSRINAETQEVYSEMQNAIDMLSKSTNLDSFDSLWFHDHDYRLLKCCIVFAESQGSDDAVRTNPVELDDNGLIFWRLKSYNDEQNILLQGVKYFTNSLFVFTRV